MRLKLICLACVLATAGSGLASAAVRTPASAPTAPKAKITPATEVADHSAALHATVIPHGADTLYYFSYGPTPVLGVSSDEKAVSATKTSQAVRDAVKGLAPGTRYYYNLHALSSTGQVTSATTSFVTGGTAPAHPLTGGAVVAGPTAVTLTGVVNPALGPTTYSFTIETATGVPVKTTVARTVAQGTHPVKVSIRVSGLSPLTTYFYNVVSTTGPSSASGAVQSFETYPERPVAGPVVVHTAPKVDATAPYFFTTLGKVTVPTSVAKPLACTGMVTINAYSGKTRVSHLLAPLTTSCRFAGTTVFGALPLAAQLREQLRLYVRFTGNHYLRADNLKPTLITLG
jgi:hypothetical protein